MPAKTHTPASVAAAARRELKRASRPSPSFDASRYFRGAPDLGFYNVGTAAMRHLARTLYANHARDWTIDDAVSCAEALIVDRYLEAKSVGIEILARYRRELTPRLLPVWKRWLAKSYAANWATTDALCGLLIGPMLVAHPASVPAMRQWTRHRSLWVRRAAAVSLIPSVRKGLALDAAYEVAAALRDDDHDLIHKAVGWMLREAGKADQPRLERYLREHGRATPRTTVRYAIERFPRPKRLDLLRATKG
jgi:3-methyladenine DNA glycosylase AlkD